MPDRVLQLDSRDNVLIALTDLNQGEQIEFRGKNYILVSSVPAKHKFATEDLATGADVIMYGVLVGKAAKPISRGERLTTSNVHHQASDFHEQSGEYDWEPPDISRWKDRTFLRLSAAGWPGRHAQLLAGGSPGVLREQKYWRSETSFRGGTGFRGAQIYRRQVAELAKLYREGKLDAPVAPNSPGNGSGAASAPALFENIDGIKFLLHEGGCGGTREDANNLCGLIAGYINHPNVAGATVLSLGCQNAQIGILRHQIEKRNPESRQARDHPGATDRAERNQPCFRTPSGRRFLGWSRPIRRCARRRELSRLCLGLKCGGSDGFSGLSANPAIGHTADLLVALGGRAILSEFPELCGVEQELINRSHAKGSLRPVCETDARLSGPRPIGWIRLRDESVSGKYPRWTADRRHEVGGGGQKGREVSRYGGAGLSRILNRAGLHLQCTPGNDVECVTAQVGAGANVVLFTTGLGTPTGNPIAPVVKLSTNSSLARRMNDIIDIDTGGIVSGETTIERMGEDILELVIKVASGEIKTKAELNAQNDFIPWKRGVSL